MCIVLIQKLIEQVETASLYLLKIKVSKTHYNYEYDKFSLVNSYLKSLFLSIISESNGSLVRIRPLTA